MSHGAVRVLFTSTGGAGHLLPLVPFARACARAGHDVLVATQRSRTGLVEQSGLTAAPFDDAPSEEVGPLMGSLPRLSHEEANRRVIGELFGRIDTRAALPGLGATIEDWRPGVIVREPAEFAGLLLAERHGIPHAQASIGLTAVEDIFLPIAAPAVDALGAGLGLAADPELARARAAPRLTLTPPLLELPEDAPAGEVHRFRDLADGPPPPNSWGDGADPIVYVTFGSVAGGTDLFPGLYRAVLDALADMAVRVLATVGEAGDPAELEPLPGNVRVERWVPQARVLPHAAAVVCHGGYGSMLGALVHGVPLVVAPLFSVDQWRNARRVAALGAGVTLGETPGGVGAGLDAEGIAALPGAVRTVIDDPGYARVARLVADEARALPPVDTAVEALRALAERSV